ncbi:50S ribosomal protein L13 [Veillonella criceti]|uniref:Large ribosomal subunit protein uL13 n=1 Tax=Veillonella criceti TaxID=103891 RepID=A0A380NMG0_9FIRM|nr:50S ribosomal protein L13 [Veillonella criceti]SUP44738.1 50S ribosomal protein L13 [Veillonella criceti]
MKTTYMANPNTIERKWYVVDAEGKTLGRLAAEVAKVLRGKNKPTFTPHVDTGDHVIVINAEKVRFTGKKLTQKTYFRHSGYPGGSRFVTLGNMLEKHPERVVEMAVRGMLPKNKLGAQIYRKLNVYAGPEHPHAAQKPEVLEFDIR